MRGNRLVKNKERRAARKNKGPKYGLMAGTGANLPPEFRARVGAKFADPEDVLQGETNDFLKAINQFQFRLSANVYRAAGDSSIGGWPDSPMFIRLAPGLALCGALELKKPGNSLEKNQEDMRAHLGTVMADTFPAVEAYAHWFRAMGETFRAHLRANPPPPLPKGLYT